MTQTEGWRWCSLGSWPWIARRIGACALALLVLCGSLTWVTTAHASSQGQIIMSPPTAAAGTQVSADVHIFGTVAQDFVLKATTTPPDQGGCASAIPIPGAPTFQAATPGGGQAIFPWPGSLGTNMYWLCAFLTTGGPDQAHTGQPFIVTQDAAPALIVTTPPDGARAGTTLQVAISGWLAPDHHAPAHLWVVSPDGLSRSEVAFQVLSPPDATGACTLSLVLPLTISPGNIFLIAGSAAFYQRSDTIAVLKLVPATASLTASPVASPTAPQAVAMAPSVPPKSEYVTFFLGLSAGVTLLLVVGGVVLMFMRRHPRSG